MIHTHSVFRRAGGLLAALIVTSFASAATYQLRQASAGMVSAAQFTVTGNPATTQAFNAATVDSYATPDLVLTLQNTGGGQGTLSLAPFGGTNASDFVSSSTCLNVQSGGTCVVTVRFKPIAAGTRTATLALAGQAYVFTGTGNPNTVGLQDFGSYRAWGDGTYATSCLGYRNGDAQHSYTGSTGDGMYQVTIGGTPTPVYCDMTRDGGGWTLIVKAQSSSNAHANTAAVGTLSGPNQTTAWKFSDATINALPKTMYRMTNSLGTVSLYYDTSDSFAATRQVANKVSKTYASPVWEGPFYNSNHRGVNAYGTSAFNRGDAINGTYTGQSSGDGCRLAIGITGGVGGWCGAGDPGTVWLK